MTTIKLLLLSALFLNSLPLYAGKIYRFIDDNGVSTLSRSLPPYAAQKGYDILDDTTLRLIERVYTRDELIKIQQRQALIDEEKNKVEQQKQAAKQRRLEQRVNDRNLLARYPTTQVLTKSRNDDITYRDSQIDDVKEQLKNNKLKLTNLQQKAAEQEMSGEEVTVNLTKRLSATQKEINNNKRYISRATEEKNETSQQYENDLKRLKYLLSITSQKPKR